MKYLLVMSLVSASVLRAQPLLKLSFPYSNNWSEPQVLDLTPKQVDFDGDGQADDWVVSRFCTTPPGGAYRTKANFTEAGPEFVMRASLAALDTTSNPGISLSSHGVTSTAFRMEATRKQPGLTPRMAYAGYFYIDFNSFRTAEMASFQQGGRLRAVAAQRMGNITWRILIKRGKEYYVSRTVSTGMELDIPDLSEEVWIEYAQAKNGRDLLLNPAGAEEVRGRFVRFIQGIGIYAEVKGFDGTALTEGDRVMFEISELTVTLPE